MSNTLKDAVTGIGQGVADAAKIVGHKIVTGTEQAMHFVKEKTGLGSNVAPASIKTHMSVIASCGKTIGVVDSVNGETIKLTKNDDPNGIHHFIPVSWVERVDTHVHLMKNSEEVEKNWKPEGTAASCCGS